MNIDAENIQRKEFHIVFKGYKPEEVDKFLDILAVEFDRLQKKNKELQDQVEKLKFEGDRESSEMKKVIQDALVSAHRIAEEIKQKAKQEADELINNKRLEEEGKYNKLLNERTTLEKNIKSLKLEYENFKEKVIKFTEDFKEKTLDIENGSTLKVDDISEEGEVEVSSMEIIPDINISENNDVNENSEHEENNKLELENFEEKGIDLQNDSVEKKIEEEITLESYINKNKRFSLIEEDLNEEKENKFIKESEKINFYSNNVSESQEKEIILPEDRKKEEEKDKVEKIEKEEETYEEFSEEDYEDGYKPKRARKKIDIANPDIINDFFKTDED